MKRLSKDEHLWHQAFAASRRGTCDRFVGGCVIAREGTLISTGYNGSAPEEPHCSDDGHELQVAYMKGSNHTAEHCVRTIHAEINAILNAARLGVCIDKCDWYITGVPCRRCSNAMARLRPQRLFLCLDRGGVTDDKSALITWWRGRYRKHDHPKVFTETRYSLRERGVAND